MEKYTENDFIEDFKRIKTEEKGRKSTTRALIGRTQNNFKKLVRAKYEKEDFEKAIIAMFRHSDQWAVSTGNDVPDHLLQPENFSRYLNYYSNELEKKEKKEVVKKTEEEPELEKEPEEIVYPEADVLQSKEIYSKSLERGEWYGSIFDALRIGKLFTNSFTVEEKRNFHKQAVEIVKNQNDKKRDGLGSIQSTFERMARNYPLNITLELAVKEAVKRKVLEPWK